ncbi:MAG: FG-GAP-like repeat-containing protein [Pseudomonadota bacterium]
MSLSTTKVYSIAAISAVSLAACGGGSNASTDSGAQNPKLNPVALNTIASISATENNSETIDISWTPGEEAELNVSQESSPELGLTLDRTSLTVTLPEVTDDVSTEFTVELIQDGETVDSQTVSVNIDNDPRQLYAQNYDDYRLAEEVATETDNWRLENIGIYAETITQDGEPQTVCYPTPEDCRESYAFYEGNADYVRGDFNDDGHTDVAVSIVYFPHTLPRDITEYPARVMIFENNGDGTMKLNNSIIADYENIHRFSAYRIKSADFNGDGVPDIVASSLYQVFDEWDEERAEHERGPELPLLLLSNGEGQLVDASNQLNLDMSGTDDASAYSIGHNMSVGDINNDGHPDIFTGISVLLNDGNGVFTDKTDDYFTADEQWSQPFASALGDMNDDGRTDLAMFNYLQVFPEPINIYRSQLLISASGGSSLTMVNQPTIIPFPEEYWGADNTHTNYAIMGDLAEDYPGDELVIAQTRLDPYYDGRILRMFALDEQENLIELTDRLENNDLRLGSEHHGYVSGEGSLHLMDFDKDGTLDIVDVTQGGSRCESEDKCQQELAVFLNQGDGTFVYNPITNIPSITEYSFEGYNFEDNDLPNLGTSYPVDLGHPSGFSLLSRVSTVGPNFLKDGDEEQMIWYIMNRKENRL